MSEPQVKQAAECTSYARDIRPKFIPEDVDHMNDLGLDLGAYTDVRDNADAILKRLKDTASPMPPRPRGPWPPEWVACLAQWIKNGKQP